jgi:hypothetical protein
MNMTRYTLLIALGLTACAGEANRLQTVNSQSEASPVTAAEVLDLNAVADTDQPTADAVWTPNPDPEIEVADASVASEPDPIEVSEFELRHGETLAHFARWSGLTIESVAESSQLGLNGTYPVGTRIVLTLAGDERARLESARDEHHQKRVEGYLASRGGAQGSEFYTVRTGDNAWVIAKNRFGIPLWLLESYNPAVDLDALRPGQDLMVPIIDDVVASAD